MEPQDLVVQEFTTWPALNVVKTDGFPQELFIPKWYIFTLSFKQTNQLL